MKKLLVLVVAVFLAAWTSGFFAEQGGFGVYKWGTSYSRIGRDYKHYNRNQMDDHRVLAYHLLDNKFILYTFRDDELIAGARGKVFFSEDQHKAEPYFIIKEMNLRSKWGEPKTTKTSTGFISQWNYADTKVRLKLEAKHLHSKVIYEAWKVR